MRHGERSSCETGERAPILCAPRSVAGLRNSVVEYGLVGDPCTPNSPDVKHLELTLRPEVTFRSAGAEHVVPWEEFLERDRQHGFRFGRTRSLGPQRQSCRAETSGR